MTGTTRFDWIKFGVYGFLLSMIGSAACGCAAASGRIACWDVYNIMSIVLIPLGAALLIVGVIGAVFAGRKRQTE